MAGMSGMTPPSRLCSSCGYTHPPPWDDQCPMGNAQKVVMNERSLEISSFCKDLADYLQEHDAYKQIIVKLRLLMQKWA